MAQSVEQFTRNEQVGGSIPPISSNDFKGLRKEVHMSLIERSNFRELLFIQNEKLISCIRAY